ncbi:hypothetical protein [Bradyrhizobium liaoningense]|nr:hypothetical protein [Bradyrhizobium liaoningense]MBR1030124.1 hypothetical protein [Bradyrhizobium liaoningense]
MHKAPKIDGFAFELEPGDKIFLTSDGIHQMIMLRELHKIAIGFDDPEAFVKAIDQTIERKTAEDNYSIVAVFVS